MPWLEVVGWAGSGLLIISLLQSHLLRFRVLNLLASLVLVAYNGLLEVWPMTAVNAAIALINIWFIVQLVDTRHDANAFTVLRVRNDDEYLRHTLRIHGADILDFQPDFIWDPAGEGQLAFLVQKDDQTVGVVLLKRQGEEAQVVLDYVSPKFRDYSPGEFVWQRSGVLSDEGIRHVTTSPLMVDPYYERVGFRRVGDRFTLTVPH